MNDAGRPADAPAAAAPLLLTLSTPQALLHERAPILGLRAADASGSFGVRPGHEDLLTVLAPGVLCWDGADGSTRWCAVDQAVLRVEGGRSIEVAAREAVEGGDPAQLAPLVEQMRAQQQEALRAARASDTRTQAQAVRKLAAWLMAASRERQP